MIRCKTAVVCRMPILRGDDQRKHGLKPVCDGNNDVAVRHRERAAMPVVIGGRAADHRGVPHEVAGNLNPVGRVYYNASTQLCVPNALSQSGGYALGAQAGEAAIRQVITDAGFTRFRRAAETPFNLVYEVRP